MDHFAPQESCAALRDEVRSVTSAWRSQGRYSPRSDAWLRAFDLEFSKELAARGLIGMTWPAEFGGGERSNVERLAVTEELLRAGAPVAAHWIGDRQIGPAILRHGSRELQEEILPQIVSVDAIFCLGMSEPEAGSDLAAVRTTATPADGGWRLNGHKIWTSHAHRATHAYVLARTERTERKHHGLTEFVVDMGAAGVMVSPIVDLAGEHHFNEVRFEDVFIPAHRVIGEIGAGWRQVVEQLSFERGGAERVLSSYPVFAQMVAHAAQQSDSELRVVVGSLVSRLAVLRQLCWEVARALDSGQAPVQQAAALKYLGNAFERDVIEALRRTELGREPTMSSSFGQALLASPGFGLRGGSAEVLLSLIAKQETRA
ncbi:acyl-CoA dehydrogenase family protein [Amycolatopsis acidiphila]|uniref:Acyl-CoA dehydrogenase n=1 Tax=Amycolatopsis acidiphila TaxID=715473 RepID=A0A558AHX9_9PSEU|nr:acyl-CoA dehydrogenase family protein [Amycolatopsis acidiphila]TVT23886.1 acyl-CoA dehydrogenase [Amycolatopsis acidiphila]UIJ61138.1 acyl-CoA dehydrogenase family protein [Amycolatopsis acidiphila]GHG86486.1 acyl-CoA dehydrogenase [Amycolatopsis acidiphila]